MRRAPLLSSLLWSLLVAGLPSPAAAEPGVADEREVHGSVILFAEPAPTQAVVVVTPSLSGRVDIKPWLSVAVDATADIVSGATPRVYGAAGGSTSPRPDAVTAATPFSDARAQIGARVDAGTGPLRAQLGYRFGTENDYRTHEVSAGARLDLSHHDTVIALRYAHDFDSVCDLDNSGRSALARQSLGGSDGCFTAQPGLTTEPLAVDAGELSLSRVITPRLAISTVLSYEHLDGFQSNPYRRVLLYQGTVEAQESHPRLRDRGSIGLRLRYAVPSAHAALALDGRAYADTWDIRSLTVDAAIDQVLLAGRLRWRARARYYMQSRAFFYRDAGEADSYQLAGPVGGYFTGDREMAPFGDVVVGGRLSYRFRGQVKKHLSDLEAGLLLDLIKVVALTPDPPDAARTRGVIDALTFGASVTATF